MEPVGRFDEIAGFVARGYPILYDLVQQGKSVNIEHIEGREIVLADNLS